MGVLSIIYCTMGGIEAVIWTDTIQTFVLLGGALLAIVLLIGGSGWWTERRRLRRPWTPTSSASPIFTGT